MTKSAQSAGDGSKSKLDGPASTPSPQGVQVAQTLTESGPALQSSNGNSESKSDEKKQAKVGSKGSGIPTSPPSQSGSEIGISLTGSAKSAKLPAPVPEFTGKLGEGLKGRVIAIVYPDGSTKVAIEGPLTGRDINGQVIRNIQREFRLHRARMAKNSSRLAHEKK